MVIVFVYISEMHFKKGNNWHRYFCLEETKAVDIPTQSVLTASQPYPSQQPCVFSGVLGTGRKLINAYIVTSNFVF